MHRKIIVNENFVWPEINEQNCELIVKFLENFFAKEPNLRRKKTLPKKMRKMNDTPKPATKADFGLYIKSKIKIGINSISKAMEKSPTNFALVLVCKSCKPLTVLTRHIQVMCSMSKTPAGCVNNLNSLSKVFNIKTVSALAICKATETKLESNQSYERLFNIFLEEIQNILVPLLSPLKNAFTSINFLDPNVMIEHVNKGLDKVDLNQDKKIEIDKQLQSFGSDFISINRSSISPFVDFDSDNFILFGDENLMLEKMEE
ncbi:ribonuclease P subunit p38 [Brachionus plicatilis]|uniref:Ribonuclease P subunit p38 n=1 Tax=Brachionus plicatilis TaxID=10195 RepID=A0A3M7SA98_BRAPC|nr:ribonuclease P subunit p38 [Brachionus plicatilis]